MHTINFKFPNLETPRFQTEYMSAVASERSGFEPNLLSALLRRLTLPKTGCS